MFNKTTRIAIALAMVGSTSMAETIRVPKDHATIQSAVDVAKRGDRVIVAAGVYPEHVRLKAGVNLKSDGDDTRGKLGLLRAEVTIIDGKNLAANQPGVEMAEGASIDGFTITNVGTYDEKAWKKHHATQGERQSYDHIGAPGVAGISIHGVSCVVKNNIVHHNGYTGISIMGNKGKTTNPHLYRNYCYRNMGGGIGAMKNSRGIIQENTCFENFYAGIGHDNASPIVQRNICHSNIRAGIGISEGASPIVRGNRCYKNRRAGIGIRSGADTRPLIEDNSCFQNDMAGIGTREEASPTIRHNRCFQNKLAGIGSRTGATPTIIGNDCYENETVGIGQQSDAVTILIGNYCHHNKKAGIGFESCREGRSTLSKNRVIANALVAIGINKGWTVRLNDNYLSREESRSANSKKTKINPLPPVVMVFEGATASFSGNTIRGGGVAGIRVAGKISVDSDTFVGTSLRRVGPPNFAIWALPGSTVDMTNNKVEGWRHALHATEATVSASKNNVRQFHSAAFVIQNPTTPADVFKNVATTSDANSKVISLRGEAGIIAHNERKIAVVKPQQETN